MEISDLKTVPIKIWLAAVATLLLAGVSGIEIMGMSPHIPLSLHYPFVLVALLLYWMAWKSAEADKNRELERQQMDVRLREAKLEAGLPPDQDRTLIRGADDR